MQAEDFDRKFDQDEADMIRDLDLSIMTRPGHKQKQKRVNVDFPVWMIESLDREASRLGAARQSLIKLWIAEQLEHHSSYERQK